MNTAARTYSGASGYIKSERIITVKDVLKNLLLNVPAQKGRGRNDKTMNVKELLGKHFEINNAINAKLEQIAELKSLATKITVSPFNGGSFSEGTYTDRVGRTTARIIDLEAEINDEIDKLVELKLTINELLSAINNSTWRTILERHYILNESWDKISEKIGYSARHINRMHSQAIEYLEGLFGENIA